MAVKKTGKSNFKKATDNAKSKRAKGADYQFNFFNLGSIFPSKKNGKMYFRPKLDEYGVQAIQIVDLEGEVHEINDESLVLVKEKTIKTKTGKMDIFEMILMEEK